MYVYQIFICNISINNNHSPSNLTNKLQTNALFLTVYLEIEGLWYYHIYCKWWIKSFYLSNSKLIDCLKGG